MTCPTCGLTLPDHAHVCKHCGLYRSQWPAQKRREDPETEYCSTKCRAAWNDARHRERKARTK